MRRIGFLGVLGLLASVSISAASPPGAARLLGQFPSNTQLYVVDALDLSPIATDYTYSCNGQNCSLRYATNSASFAFQAAVHLPAGAKILAMQIDGWDDSVIGEIFASLYICNLDGTSCDFAGGVCGPQDATVCSGVPENPGWTYGLTDLSSFGLVASHVDQRIYIIAGNSTNSGTTSIGRILFYYQLSVSPGPATATFNDVPTTHPFFQYVEALAASGVTGGCGSGNYCPDAPLTRGQMAVFLAKALGLWFP